MIESLNSLFHYNADIWTIIGISMKIKYTVSWWDKKKVHTMDLTSKLSISNAIQINFFSLFSCVNIAIYGNHQIWQQHFFFESKINVNRDELLAHHSMRMHLTMHICTNLPENYSIKSCMFMVWNCVVNANYLIECLFNNSLIRLVNEPSFKPILYASWMHNVLFHTNRM